MSLSRIQIAAFIFSIFFFQEAWAAPEELPELACPGSYFTKKISQTEGLLKGVQTAYVGMKTLSADFSQRSYLAALEMSEKSVGTVRYAQPGKMKWKYSSPNEQTFLVDKTKLWLYQPEENQLVIDNFSSVLITDIPIAFLLGMGDLSKQFSVHSACEGEDALVFHLQPQQQGEKSTDTSEKLQNFVLVVSKKDSIPIGAEVVDVAGNRTAVWFRNVSVNPVLSEDTFLAQFPKGIDVIDRS